jgi:hypothetical protein
MFGRLAFGHIVALAMFECMAAEIIIPPMSCMAIIMVVIGGKLPDSEKAVAMNDSLF